jgi:hypothetical protein
MQIELYPVNVPICHQPPQWLSQSYVGGVSNQAFGKFKKAALFIFLGFESSFDQFFDDMGRRW